MNQLSIKDALDIMQSDMKLWENADKKSIGEGKISLTLDLPWGIGEYTVTLEGLTNAQGKRNAVGAYGEHIRAIIKERIDDEAVTSRAKAAAAQREFSSGSDRDSLGSDTGLRDEKVPSPSNESTSDSYEETSSPIVGSREGLVAERTKIEAEIERQELNLTRLKREVRVLTAALAAWEEDDEYK